MSLPDDPARVEAFHSTLSPDERQRAARFHFERDRRRFIAARGLQRAILAQYLGRAPVDLVFHYGPAGKPSLAAPGREPPLFFNISRSGACALYAVTTRGEIGVDLESAREVPDWPAIARRLQTHDAAFVPPRSLAEFFHEWTRHEARMKAAGVGLGGHLGSAPWWTVHSLALGPSLFAAVALPGPSGHPGS